MSDSIPQLEVEQTGRTRAKVLSAVWLVPLAALAIALGIAWQNYNDQGPLITIRFEDGAGIKARETELRFRDVTVGVVEGVAFAPDLSGVIAEVRLDKVVAPFVDASASFWVVQPELSAQGVTGLDTVLSGVYIEGAWDNEVGEAETRFVGLSSAPLFRTDRTGLEIVLRTTPGGTMTDNSPITFRGIEVGRIGRASISPDGDFAIAEALIYDPHSRLISSATRFWDTTGFTFSVGPSGAEIDFSSLATLVGGGVTFDTFVSGGTAVNDGQVFEIYSNETTARNSLFSEAEVETLDIRVVFDENISGLAVDAPVEINGLQIGKVQSVLGVISAEEFGDRRVRLNVVLAIQPARLGLLGEVTPEAAQRFLSERVRGGMRAQLANASLLTGGLKIDLVQVDDAAPAELRTDLGGLPIFPTVESDVADAAATVEGVINRVNELPIEELLFSAIEFLDSAEALVSDPDLRETPAEVRALVGDVATIVGSEEAQELLVTVSAAVTRVEGVLAEIENAQLATRLVDTLDGVVQAADTVASSVEGVPALIEDLRGVAAKAQSVPVEALAEELTALAGSVDAILSTPATQRLPEDFSAALAELNATLTELREGGVITNVNATLQSASDAADAIAVATEDLPALASRLRGVLDQASATISGFDQGESISRDVQSTLRDISNAAEALESLARMLERNPDALIRGRR